jgi:uncharacterized protein
MTGGKKYRLAAEKTLRLFSHRLQTLPQAVPHMLVALDFSMEEPRRAVIVGDSNLQALRDLVRAAHSVFQPHKVVLGNTGPVEEFVKTLPAQEAPMAFICTGTACQTPTRDPEEVRTALAQS